MTHKLEADGIQLKFGNRVILSDIYLKCETGKITGLLGRNGQGKSCLMKAIYGPLKCEKSIRIDNVPQYEAFKRPDLLMFLPQFNFIPKGLSLKRVFDDFDLDYSLFEKRFTGSTTGYKSNIRNLSGGEHRLVELYIIVKSITRFVILDEPFTPLNPIQAEEVTKLLLEEKGNKGILITDHLFKHITDICDSLYLLADGKIHLAKEIEDIEALGYAKL
jgi:ABC-type lipopolysaccharide export system ATPase subunit